MPSVNFDKSLVPSVGGGFVAAPPVWEQRPGEDDGDYSRFLVFCKNSEPTETITEYVLRSYPGQPEMLDLAIVNDWWPRRLGYATAIKEMVVAHAQTVAFMGVAKSAATATEALMIFAKKMSDLHEKGETDSVEYSRVFKQFEATSRILTQAAKATTSVEIKQINANIAPGEGGKVAVFSDAWNG